MPALLEVVLSMCGRRTLVAVCNEFRSVARMYDPVHTQGCPLPSGHAPSAGVQSLAPQPSRPTPPTPPLRSQSVHDVFMSICSQHFNIKQVPAKALDPEFRRAGALPLHWGCICQHVDGAATRPSYISSYDTCSATP